MHQITLYLSITAFIFYFLQYFPGFEIEHPLEAIFACFIVGFSNFLILPMLAILNITLRPLMLFLFSLMINLLLLNVATGLMDEFNQSSWMTGLIGAMLLSLTQVLTKPLSGTVN